MISKGNICLVADMVGPPPRLKISEWAQKFAFIPSTGNAEPGKFRLSRMPHQEEMLDDPLDPGVGEIFWMLASQAGGKTLGINLICEYAIHQLKRDIIVARATRETALEWMRDKFLPMTEATECMKGLLFEPRKRGSNSTSLNRKFPGGGLKVIGAKSPAAFRGSSAGIILADELDTWVTIKEGSPLDLLDRAAITFSNKWKLRCSTPTLEGFSQISDGYERGDKKQYFVPCPCCGEFQVLKDENLKFSFSDSDLEIISDPSRHPSNHTWEIGDFPNIRTRNAIYVCEFCRKGWTDTQRIQSYMSGHVDNEAIRVSGEPLRAKWKATADFTGVRSRQLSGMYLTIGLDKDRANYLHQFAENFLKAKRGGRETLMVWTNIFKTIPFEEPGERTDWKTIKDRAEDYGPDLPDEAVWCAFGMDVQADRIEILSLAWGDGQECWAMDHHVMYGDFDMPGMHDRVAEHLTNKRFNHRILGPIPYSAGAIDSGHQTKVQAVYRFCAKHALSNFWSVKGFDQALGGVYKGEKEKRFGGQRFNLNTDYLKNMIFDRLKNTEHGARYIHFPKEEITTVSKEGVKRIEKTRFDARFFMQLCSERRIPVKQPKGGYVFRWMKLTSSTRNEVLDCTVYAFGVFEICKQENWIAKKWKEVQAKLKEENKPDPVSSSVAAIVAPSEAKIPELVDRSDKHTKAVFPRRRLKINSPFANRFGFK